MRQQGSWPHWLGVCLLTSSLATSSGCLTFLHPCNRPPGELVQACREAPEGCLNHVYIFLIHGMDPLDYANLEGVRDYCHRFGFTKTYYGQLYHTAYFRKEISRIHSEDPQARFILIGFSFGANMVRNIAQDVKQEGIPIELLVYMGGNTLKNIPSDRPENAVRIVNILASGCIWNGAWLDRAENLHETDVWHFGSPSHPRTLHLLAEELSRVATVMSAGQPADTSMPAVFDNEPTPRNLNLPSTPERDEWDFLKPVSRLKPAPENGVKDKTPPKSHLAARAD